MKNTSINEKLVVTIPLSLKITKGLSDPHRIKILDLLYHKELSVSELMIYLKKSNLQIATTTLRHHLNILKKNGLIRISKTKEVKGILVKYYRSTLKTIFFNDYSFESVASDNIKIINSLYPKLYKIINELLTDEKNFILAQPKSKTMCKICNANHYNEFLLFMIFSVVLTKVLNKALKTKII
ncbi:MAG: winged helix-turn-helix transcriptional regulator [Nitrosopumilus sp.]|nr:winged helix-turn-helix transcriptional regulator [Nitrosopumilus sp.]